MDHTRPAPPLAHPYHCLRLRHQAATCRACADACPRQAIELAPGPTIDLGRCSGCGVCGAVCPTGALAASSPTLEEALSECGPGIVACRRAAGPRGPLPCLGYLDAGLLLAAATLGEVTGLDAGPCAACPAASGLAQAERALAEANAVLRALGWSEPLLLVRERGYAGEPGLSRRGLLAWLSPTLKAPRPTPPPTPVSPQAKGRASRAWLKPPRRALLLKALAALAAGRVAPLPEEMGDGLRESDQPLPSQHGTARLGNEANLTPFPPSRHGKGEQDRSLPPLPLGEGWGEGPLHPKDGVDLTPCPPFRAGKGEQDSPVPGLPFWDLSLGEACDGCGMCFTFCPSGALRSERRGPKAAMVFLPEWCLGCDLCAKVCPRRAIALSAALRLPARDEARDLRLVPVARCGRCGAAYPVLNEEPLCPACRQKQQLQGAIRGFLFRGQGNEPQMNTDTEKMDTVGDEVLETRIEETPARGYGPADPMGLYMSFLSVSIPSLSVFVSSRPANEGEGLAELFGVQGPGGHEVDHDAYGGGA